MTIHPEHQKFTLSYNRELREASRPPAPSVELEVDGHTCHLPVNVRVVAVSRIADSAEPQSLPDLTPSPHEVTIHIVCEDEEIDLAEKLLRDHQEEARQGPPASSPPISSWPSGSTSPGTSCRPPSGERAGPPEPPGPGPDAPPPAREQTANAQRHPSTQKRGPQDHPLRTPGTASS